MNQFHKVAFYTLGCKLNFAETSTLARQFEEAGYARVEWEEQPDVLVINTCSVTDQADKKCRNIVSRAVRTNEHVFVAVVGCYAQLKPQEIVSIPGVNVVLGAKEKFNILQHVRLDSPDKGKVVAGEIKEVRDFVPSFSAGDRTRTFLKVQDGCNYFCAFCTIPLARGRSRSASIANTLAEASKAIAAGAREIVLTGVNIGDFGTANGESFLDLAKALDELKGIDRFRISSIEPNLLTDDIIDFVGRSKKFVPHFHIPLQSGSDSILQAMRRRYRTALYRERIERILSVMPDACIGVDVITGFPGETEELFMETVHFIQSIDIAYLHVFTYSERASTTALRLADTVPIDVRHQRTAILRQVSDKKKRAFYSKHTGAEGTVLWESAEEDGWMYGFTENYLKVKKPWKPEAANTLEKVHLGQPDLDCVFSSAALLTGAIAHS
jgi:threonylcarbamoyladenosine tRNA methylthiotransferase MtaB